MTDAAFVHAAMILLKQESPGQARMRMERERNESYKQDQASKKLDQRANQARDLASRISPENPTPQSSSPSPSKGPGLLGAAKGIAAKGRDKVLGTEGTDAADADINQRFNKLTGGDSSADPEGVFQGDPGLLNAAGDMANRAQGNASSAMTRAKDSMAGAAEKISQGYSDMSSNVVPKVDAAIDRGIQSAANLYGQGKDAASALNQKYNTPENRTAAWEGAKNVGSKLLGGAKALGRGVQATAQGASNLAGRMAYGAVDPATGQRTGRDASGFINPNDKLGTLGAGIKGAFTGQGAMNAIEQRNQNKLSTNDLNFDREAQTNLKQGVQSADAEKRWASMPANVHEGMGIAGQTGDADGNGIPDVEETQTTSTDGATGEVTQTNETKVTPPAATPPAATPAASSGGNAMSSGGSGMSSGQGTASSGQPSQSNKIAENALASEQAGKLSEANQRAGKSWSDGGVGTGLASNLLTFGGSGLARLGANAMTRRGGRKDATAARTNLQSMTGPDPSFTASFDSPLDEYWGLQKTMQNIRMRDSTEAIRYALQ